MTAGASYLLRHSILIYSTFYFIHLFSSSQTILIKMQVTVTPKFRSLPVNVTTFSIHCPLDMQPKHTSTGFYISSTSGRPPHKAFSRYMVSRIGQENDERHCLLSTKYTTRLMQFLKKWFGEATSLRCNEM